MGKIPRDHHATVKTTLNYLCEKIKTCMHIPVIRIIKPCVHMAPIYKSQLHVHELHFHPHNELKMDEIFLNQCR